jgi:hypothetical protein
MIRLCGRTTSRFTVCSNNFAVLAKATMTRVSFMIKVLDEFEMRKAAIATQC